MTCNTSINVHWFRADLRLGDNPALTRAAADGAVMPIYILDDENAGEQAMGGASRWWLHHSLNALNRSLGGKLNLYRGNAEHILQDVAKRHPIKAVYWNRCYEPWRVARDARIKDALKKRYLRVESFNGSLLWEPWEIKKNDGEPYKVFTPFYRNGCLSAAAPHDPLPAPARLEALVDNAAHGLPALRLLPRIRWDKQLEPHWNIGEEAAQERLYAFLEEGMPHYAEGRNFPAKPYVSRLSPHLHVGEISPRQAWHAARARGDDVNVDRFCAELGWREFSYHLLYRFPELPNKNLQSTFDRFPWRRDADALARWKRGFTGFPIVDAGMRELWNSGYMHNRVRMIVGSFLVKNLLLDWRCGERWFWDCLVDADLANNAASWQWVAGCGADAAPYFRVFNPVTQGEKFDPDGKYTRRWVPELTKLPDRYLFKPWEAPESILRDAGVTLGKTYPTPATDISESRKRALAVFSGLKNSK
ncbi:MAG: deoxyribodipyrimidine photo-lyase [Rickettsiales bacterium]